MPRAWAATLSPAEAHTRATTRATTLSATAPRVRAEPEEPGGDAARAAGRGRGRGGARRRAAAAGCCCGARPRPFDRVSTMRALAATRTTVRGATRGMPTRLFATGSRAAAGSAPVGSIGYCAVFETYGGVRCLGALRARRGGTAPRSQGGHAQARRAAADRLTASVSATGDAGAGPARWGASWGQQFMFLLVRSVKVRPRPLSITVKATRVAAHDLQRNLAFFQASVRKPPTPVPCELS
jgi:hypothetical protein